MTNLLLGAMVLLLLWGLVLREPVLRLLALRAQRRRVLDGLIGTVPVAMPTPDASFTLLLCDPQGTLEHEITRHGITEAPTEFSYAGKVYQRGALRPDGAWEYTR